MVAINHAFSTLVHRYTVEGCRGIPTDGNTWNFFPFNNERFCSLAGIEVGAGLSQPPAEPLRSKLSSRAIRKWTSEARGGEEFLKFCDEARRRYGNTVTIEVFQRDVLNNAPKRNAWEWLISTLWQIPGGIGDKLIALGHDLGCDAEEAYRSDRESKMDLYGPEFKEKLVVGTKFDSVWLGAQAPLARAVFGDPKGNGRPVPNCYPTLRAMMFRQFQTAATRLKKKAHNIDDLESKVKESYETANARPMLKNLRNALSEYRALISIQRALGITGSYEENGPWRKRLDGLMEDLGRKQSKGKTVKSRGKHPKVKLVSEEDLDQIWREYRAAIWVPAPLAEMVDDDENHEQLTTGPVKGLNDFPPNAGVERWAKRTITEMRDMLLIPPLGLPGSRPQGEDDAPIGSYLWHQYVGAIEMIDRSFSDEIGVPGRPTLVADEVGMGKTAQSILFLQMIWHLKCLQDSNPKWPEIEGGDDRIKKWPAFLGKRTHFMGHERIPSLPSVIVAPPTLLSMWLAAVSTWLSDKACNILVYKGTVQQRWAFFEEGSPYDRAKKGGFLANTIIFAEASAVLADGRAELVKQGDRRAGEPSTGSPGSFERTIFSKDFLLAILEEGHLYRNGGQNYSTMVTIMSRAAQRMVLTATPVFTHPRDLLNLGRLLQALHFIGSYGVELTKRVTKMFKENQGNWDSEEEQEKLREFLSTLRGVNSNAGSEPEPAGIPHINELLPEHEANMESYKAFWSTREGLYELRRVMKPYIIRRDNRSVDCDGNPLLGLLPLLEITSYLQLDEPTIAELKGKMGGNIDRSEVRMDLSGFFTRLKKILVHPRLSDPKPEKKSLDSWIED
ncbi:hypothetical protein FRC11_011212, partial [Ceratobasidium sp. 423]